MRLSREYFFDIVELVGKAVTTARKKAAGPEWDMDQQIDSFLRRWQMKLDPLEKAIREEARAEDDHWGLFESSTWQDSAEDGQKGAVGEPKKRETYSEWGSEKFEQRRAQRCYDDFGDGVSCQLWKLMRQVQFKETRVVDALKDLQRLCHRLSGYISRGWASRLAQIIDQSSP